MKQRHILIVGLLFGCSILPASPIFGNFDIDGSVTVTLDNMHWVSNLNIPNQATIGGVPDGSFTGLGGTNVTIADLTRATEPVNTAFPEQEFIGFLGNPLLPHLEVGFIDLGAFSSTDCFAAPAAGQVCTPDVPGGSPFMFVNTSGTSSSATWSVSGVTSDGLSNWTGVLTSQFTTPYQDVLAVFFGPAGAVTHTYSGTFEVSVTPVPVVTAVVPEPARTSLIGMGLILAGIGLKRLKKRQA